MNNEITDILKALEQEAKEEGIGTMCPEVIRLTSKVLKAIKSELSLKHWMIYPSDEDTVSINVQRDKVSLLINVESNREIAWYFYSNGLTSGNRYGVDEIVIHEMLLDKIRTMAYIHDDTNAP